MTLRKSRILSRFPAAVAALFASAQVLCWIPAARAAVDAEGVASLEIAAVRKAFQEDIQPVLKEYCVRCHNADKAKSGVRVDVLNGGLEDKQLFIWKKIREQVIDEAMPPEEEAQPTTAQRRLVSDWIAHTLGVARRRPREKNGSIRRLTIAQYNNTLRDLLGIEDQLTDVLPPDGMSKDGFLNNGQTMLLTPLMVEAYFNIASKALDLCIVDEGAKPPIQNFRVKLGASVNPEPCLDRLKLNGGGNLLSNRDFAVTQLIAEKPFDFEPFLMRTKFEFIEGYQGNTTVRGWRTFDSIYHAVFASILGGGTPKGRPNQMISEGLLLRPAVPGANKGRPLPWGPAPTFTVTLRELPDQGKFRVTVEAARYEDGLLLDPGAPLIEEGAAETVSVTTADGANSWDLTREIDEAGIYQVDITLGPGKPQNRFELNLGDRQFSGKLFETVAAVDAEVELEKAESAERAVPFMLVRLPAGPVKLSARFGDNTRLRRIALTRLTDRGDAVRRFEVFEKRSPRVGVHLGVRRDCGNTMNAVGKPQPVSSSTLKKYVFEEAISNFPDPDIEENNVNYLAGLRDIGVRSEYTDGRDTPRLLVRSVEFEGPFYETWPPRNHTRIFFKSHHGDEPASDAREIIEAFAVRAFRRPITHEETASLLSVWADSFAETRDFNVSIKDALLVVLTSPQFLFLIEDSEGPEPEPVDAYELASKLSYFLWNSAPDPQLLDLASNGALRASLDSEIDRMIQDPRFVRFVDPFVSQWLSLDKFGVVEIDHTRYPKLTPELRKHLRREPVQYLKYLIQRNLPLRNLVQSDFIVANEVVADYYGLGRKAEQGFEFIPVQHESENLGGVLTQVAILAGLSDGRESNPVKRGAWLARKIIAEPPDDPPPNVPALPEDGEGELQLTLRERLERHRNQEGCAECHTKIDPWGIPLEQFGAAGLIKTDTGVDARSTLPDGTQVADVNGLKAYLAHDRIDQVAFSFLKHLASYAAGRSLSYHENEYLKQEGLQLEPDGYRMADMIRFVVQSPLFLEK